MKATRVIPSNRRPVPDTGAGIHCPDVHKDPTRVIPANRRPVPDTGAGIHCPEVHERVTIASAGRVASGQFHSFRVCALGQRLQAVKQWIPASTGMTATSVCGHGAVAICR
jgi:hypothetical protein